MKKQKHNFIYQVYGSANELSEKDFLLLTKARHATKDAYAPYSNFHVGAAAQLANGRVITATNQENASYPAGICSERVLLSAAAALYPAVSIHTIAISYHNKKGKSNRPVSPCGICRQSLLEYEARFQHPIRIILSGMRGEVYVIPKAGSLLPLSFTAYDMK
ncbi:MAG: cytidine deaminase [Parafilimonas sp.]